MNPWPFILAVIVFLAGMVAGVKVHTGLVAERDLAQRVADNRTRLHQVDVGLQAGEEHAQTVETLNSQLVDANAEIARLQARACLDPRTVRVLNATGVVPHGATAGQPAGAAAAAQAAGGDAGPAGPAGLRWASNIDVGQYIAYCRIQHAKLVDQVNQILTIEDARFPPATD